MTKKVQSIPASFWRRCGAWLYDGLIVIALLMFAGAIGLGIAALMANSGVITTDGYIDISDYLGRHEIASLIYSFYLFLIPIAFYGYFWCHHGQTLGMQAWRLKLQTPSGQKLKFTQALIRLATAAFGLGNFLVLINQSKQSLQDLMAECEMVYLPKEK